MTIIVLLILAGIAISLTIGNNGLFNRAGNAANTWRKAESSEQDEMRNFEGVYDNTIKDLGLGDGGSGGENEELILKPNTEEASSEVTFATSYGKIDVIWLDTSNKVMDKPNNPANSLGGMTPVKWDGTTESETVASDANWYNYTSVGKKEIIEQVIGQMQKTMEAILYGYQDMHIE